MKRTFFLFTLLLFVLCIPSVRAQNDEKSDFCNNNWGWGDRKQTNEIREMTIAATRDLKVDGKRNGGISVRGENRSDILIRACVVAWTKSADASSDVLKSIRLETSPVVLATSTSEESNWSVSYEIRVPKNTNLELAAHNGGIAIRDVEGVLNFETRNGGISLSEVAGSVKGRTQNGGIAVKVSGNSWKGGGLDVETTNGGVSLAIPQNFSAKIEAGTTNGGFSSDFEALQPESKRSWGKRLITRELNGGGPPVRVVTVNGGIKISSKK